MSRCAQTFDWYCVCVCVCKIYMIVNDAVNYIDRTQIYLQKNVIKIN